MTTDHDTAVEAENHSELWQAGISLRREVLGDSYVSESLQRTAGTESEALQTHITETVWGAVWTRPGLDRRSRSLLNLGILVALNQHHELAVHVRGGLRNGLTPGEIVESIIHATAYCGAPAGLAAMRVVQKTLDEESRAAHDTEVTPA
ncbi:carboxymuconolactone decarboxylase family protein [Arthrobacter globiformis]|uniref:carboxymuconolactone decarboxylase family protein n=1 Tax=Arthrobacter globiformis TaxID=1665 RepID=UPI0027852F25|nr:carboxymuconolactone decarboxylase family protein [Arthrobacter globiformis]MDQ0864586.1 4-carboxymuconolactone decarboxylase [Arthrobacter globiformis]